MSGVFSVHCRHDAHLGAGIASDLGRRMEILPWQKMHCIESGRPGLILGCTTNNGTAPVEGVEFRRDGDLACVVENYLIRSSQACGIEADIAAGRYADAAIGAYRRLGETFCESLEGPFTIILHDGARQLLIAGNGRFASSLLYGSDTPGRQVYCSKLGPMARAALQAPAHDPQGMSRFLSYGMVIGTETLVSGVKVLEPASYTIHDLQKATSRSTRYWHLGKTGGFIRDLPFRQHVDDLCDTLLAANDRVLRRPGRYISALSGGMDSRMVLALAVRNKPDLKAWTFGAADSSDILVSDQLCEHYGLEHLKFPIEPELIAQESGLYATTVDGVVTANFAFGMQRTRALHEQGDIVLNGVAAEMMAGSAVIGPSLNFYPAYLRDRLRGSRVQPHPIADRVRTDAEMARFVEKKYGKRTKLADTLPVRLPPMRQDIETYFRTKSADIPLAMRGEEWILSNRVYRWTMVGVISDRNFYSDGSQFYDYEVIERGMRTPHAYRRNIRLYKALFARLAPEIAHIINGNTGKPISYPVWKLNALTLKSHVLKKMRLTSSGVVSTGMDLNGVTRGVNRDFYQDLISDPRTQSRPFWDGEKLADLCRRHMDGEIDLGHELGLIASVEMFWRQWMDRP